MTHLEEPKGNHFYVQHELYHWIDGRYSEADNFGVRVDPAKSGKYKSVIMRK